MEQFETLKFSPGVIDNKHGEAEKNKLLEFLEKLEGLRWNNFY